MNISSINIQISKIQAMYRRETRKYTHRRQLLLTNYKTKFDSIHRRKRREHHKNGKKKTGNGRLTLNLGGKLHEIAPPNNIIFTGLSAKQLKIIMLAS